MSDILIETVARSNVGKRRGNNEDNFYLGGENVNSLNDKIVRTDLSEEGFTAVLDGMGGESSGEKASLISAMACDELKNELLDSEFSDESILHLFNKANSDVCDEIVKIQKRMGSTLVLLGVKNNQITIANIGDSRAYLYRNGELKQISKDHTEAQTMVDAGLISWEDSQSIKEKHKLTQHIGIFEEEMIIEPYIKRFSGQVNDKILLCSDGLTDMLTNEEIKTLLDSDDNAENIVNNLVEAALDKGGKDNVTVNLSIIKSNKKEKKILPFLCIILAIVLLITTSVGIYAYNKNKENKGNNKTAETEVFNAENTDKPKRNILGYFI